MPRYECTLPEYHDDDEWIEIEAHNPEAAARAFADYMDGRDSEMFMRPDKDATDVKVRRLGASDHQTFNVNFYYVKSWYIRRIETV
jgi:hypothetical protein